MSLALLSIRGSSAYRRAGYGGAFLASPAGILCLCAVTAWHATAQPTGAVETPSSPTPQWQSLGPQGVLSPDYGILSGRVTSLALDSNDPTGNRLYAGTTGGGVWLSQNAAISDSGQIAWTALTENVNGFKGNLDPSLSMGALTVQPGGTGVILAGTGDPNNALDSYYGGGILRSTDGGITWDWIVKTSDLVSGLAAMDYGFTGEAFAGFAWSTADSQTVVAAVMHARRTALVGALWPGFSYAGLYYSKDSGATWHLATVTDGDGQHVQAPLDAMSGLDGNAATAVVWNPLRKLFVAAVQYHGYYQSPDGVVWTRLEAQPGTGLTPQQCPTNYTWRGSTGCPLQRGALAVNPLTGDTFAWTIDVHLQDQGLWQDACNAQGSTCSNPSMTFAKQWDTTSLRLATVEGAATILDGDYNLVLAAIPSPGDTVLFAGADDLWRCSLVANCTWRNTTHATGCKSAKVAPHQHALEWNRALSQQVFIGNDGGVWRSADLIGESGAECSAADADHFQNLNTSLGSLAAVSALAVHPRSSYSAMASLANSGVAGVKDSGPTANWPTIFSGYGGPVAMDPSDPNRWYVNAGPGASIFQCAQSVPCTPTDFGTSPVVSNADLSGDGDVMMRPAPFLLDPLDPAQLLVGTCRVWRGPADGTAWTSANAISSFLDSSGSATSCSGKALIRSMAALALADGGEVVYVGTYGASSDGPTLPGHIFRAILSADGAWSKWQDLSQNPVANDTDAFNRYGYDISSIFVDPHDSAGNTVYATVAAFPSDSHYVRVLYRSTDGGTHWSSLSSNLIWAPANGVVIDPFDANTAYVATDLGVFSTRNVSGCAAPAARCWTAYGAGLPMSPVVQLATSIPDGSNGFLLAATYGRGLWQIPLLNSSSPLTTASMSPTSLTFAAQSQWTSSDAQTITLTNTGSVALTPTSIAVSGDFFETDNCTSTPIASSASCSIQVKFAPAALGTREGQLTVNANIKGASLFVALAGTGTAPKVVSLMPDMLDFGAVVPGGSSFSLPITVENSGDASISISSLTVTPPFTLTSNACGTSALLPHSDCQMLVKFTPSQSGATSGTLTLVDAAGTQIAELSGTGTSPATDILTPDSLTFPDTTVGQFSPAQTVSLTNNGDVPLTSISVSTTGSFQATSNCTTQLAARSSCAIRVLFIPVAAGLQQGALMVSDILRSQSVSLSGTGLLPAGFSVTPLRIDFGMQGLGKTSAPQTLTVTNNSASAATGLSFSITGPFSIAHNLCGNHLDPGARCTVGASFLPTAAGEQTGTLAVSASIAPAVKVPLSGTGFDFGVSISGSSIRTVASGQTATYTLSVIPSAGTTASFTFQCEDLPAHASCVFNPATNTIVGGVAASESVQVLTAPVVAKRSAPSWPPSEHPLLLAGMMFFLGRKSRGRRMLLSLALLLLLVAFVTDCTSSGGGGASSRNGNAQAAAAGTYTIPVTVTSAGVQHTVSVTLVVD